MTRKGDRLGVWIDGLHAADLIARDGIGNVSCQYHDEAFENWEHNSPVLSCSLPLTRGSIEATPFFRGLLPEGDALRVMAERANVTSTDTFGLLERYGRDVAGALVIGREHPGLRREGIEPLRESDLEDAVDSLDENPLGIVDESELSLAGLQNKILLVKHRGGWARPLNGLPSTHILKLDDLRFPGLVRAEQSCLLLARQLGLTTVDAELLEIGGRDCLVVSRFDRTVTRGGVTRVHQEDLCQATGVDPILNRGRVKYERYGGPGFKAAATLLDRFAADPVDQLVRLVRAVTFTVLIGNADAHGKNLALLHPAPGTITLAPLYDTVPTRLWPKLRSEAAMSVGGQVEMEDITADEIAREARLWPFAESRAREATLATAAELLDAAGELSSTLDRRVTGYATARAEKLLA